MCNCIVSSRGFRLRAFYECKDVHGTYILYSQTIKVLCSPLHPQALAERTSDRKACISRGPA